MKTKDISAGEDYLVGYYGKGQVTETLVPRGNRKDGVKVIITLGYYAGREILVSSREIKCLWSEHQAKQDAMELKRKIDQRDRQKVSDKVELLERAFEAAGVSLRSSETQQDWRNRDAGYFGAFFLEEDSIERLIDFLGASEIPTAEASGNELIDLLG